MKQFKIIDKNVHRQVSHRKNREESKPIITISKSLVTVRKPAQIKIGIIFGDRVLMAESEGFWYIAKATESQFKKGYCCSQLKNTQSIYFGSKKLSEKTLGPGSYLVGEPEFDGTNEWYLLERIQE